MYTHTDTEEHWPQIFFDRGMNIQDVAQILGHADLKTTQIYCYISQQNVKTAYRKYAS